MARSLAASVSALQSAGAKLVTGGTAVAEPGFRFCNTLLRASGDEFLADPEKLQTEAFGNAALVVVCESGRSEAELRAIFVALDDIIRTEPSSYNFV